MKKTLAAFALSMSVAFAQTPTPTIADLQKQFETTSVKQQLAYERLSHLQDFRDYLNFTQQLQTIQEQAVKLQSAPPQPRPPTPASQPSDKK